MSLPAMSRRLVRWGRLKPSYTGQMCVTPSPESTTTPVRRPKTQNKSPQLHWSKLFVSIIHLVNKQQPGTHANLIPTAHSLVLNSGEKQSLYRFVSSWKFGGATSKAPVSSYPERRESAQPEWRYRRLQTGRSQTSPVECRTELNMIWSASL